MTKFFDAESCLDVIRDKLELNRDEKGYAETLAARAGCPTADFSRVLLGRALLTLDQAEGLAKFWKLDELQSEFFITLVDLQRETDVKLMNHLQNRIEHLRAASHS